MKQHTSITMQYNIDQMRTRIASEQAAMHKVQLGVARWRGEFRTLWRAPSGFSGRIDGREGGSTLAWLGAQLAALDGAAPSAGRPILDAALQSRVLAFQLAQGLPADGWPGPMTFMQLNRVAGIDEPRLQTAP